MSAKSTRAGVAGPAAPRHGGALRRRAIRATDDLGNGIRWLTALVSGQLRGLTDLVAALRPGRTARRARLATKIFLVAIVFLSIPSFVYQRFEEADRDKTELLLQSSLEQGRLIAHNIRPLLDDGSAQLPNVDQAVATLAGEHLNIRLLYRPMNDPSVAGFFYVASHPHLGSTYLESERRWLQRSGVLKRLSGSCREDEAVGIRHAAADSSEQLIAAITPVLTNAGCWAIITSYAEQQFLSTSLGKPYWEAPEVQFAALLYMALATFVIVVLVRIWSSVRNFRRIAIDISHKGNQASRSFVEQNQTPELDDVAVEFDRMVQRLGTLSFSVERSPNPIIITDAEWSIEFVNPAFSRLTGYAETEILGRDPRMLMADLSQAWLWVEIRDRVASGKVWDGEYLSSRRDGSTYWAHLSVYRLIGPHDRVERLVWIQQDVSEHKRLMNELIDAKNRAEGATAVKSAFLARMSHELRTPLNAILGFSEIISNELYGQCNVPKYVDYASSIHQSGAHLLALINDILDLSKLEAGGMKIVLETLDLRAVADEVLTLFEPEAESRSISLSVDIDPEAASIVADRRSIKQILINLLSNGIKFTPADGRITVSTRRLQDSATLLAVSDTGSGIDERDLPTIMDPYTQGTSEYVRLKEGTGLGLPIVKRLAELHGGMIRIITAAGAGTTVEAIFPDVVRDSTGGPATAQLRRD